jgi:hypothetical protein
MFYFHLESYCFSKTLQFYLSWIKSDVHLYWLTGCCYYLVTYLVSEEVVISS